MSTRQSIHDGWTQQPHIQEQEQESDELTALRAQLDKTLARLEEVEQARVQEAVEAQRLYQDTLTEVDRWQKVASEAQRERDEHASRVTGAVVAIENLKKGFDKMERERDQWRGVATRLAESLRDLHDRSNALADFDKLNAQ
jgi:chromosome segregation ATPase